MSPEEQAKWLDSMDEEIQALFKSGACEFTDCTEVLKQCKEIVNSAWAFWKKHEPSGEVTWCKSRLCVHGNPQKATVTYDCNESFAPVVGWVTVHSLFMLGLVKTGKWQASTLPTPSLRPHCQNPSFLNFHLDALKPILSLQTRSSRSKQASAVIVMQLTYGTTRLLLPCWMHSTLVLPNWIHVFSSTMIASLSCMWTRQL